MHESAFITCFLPVDNSLTSTLTNCDIYSGSFFLDLGSFFLDLYFFSSFTLSFAIFSDTALQDTIFPDTAFSDTSFSDNSLAVTSTTSVLSIISTLHFLNSLANVPITSDEWSDSGKQRLPRSILNLSPSSSKNPITS